MPLTPRSDQSLGDRDPSILGLDPRAQGWACSQSPTRRWPNPIMHGKGGQKPRAPGSQEQAAWNSANGRRTPGNRPASDRPVRKQVLIALQTARIGTKPAAAAGQEEQPDRSSNSQKLKRRTGGPRRLGRGHCPVNRVTDLSLCGLPFLLLGLRRGLCQVRLTRLWLGSAGACGGAAQVNLVEACQPYRFLA